MPQLDHIRKALVTRRADLRLGTYAVTERMRAMHPEVAGCQRRALQRWELGLSAPTDLQLAAWAEALGLRLELVEGEAVAAAAPVGDELDPPTGARAARRRAA